MAQYDNVTGLLFSNADHKIIFLDKTLQAMLNFPEQAVSHFIGEPAFKILGLSEEQYRGIAEKVVNSGSLDAIPLELTNQQGEKVQIVAKGVSNTDNKGELISIDYIFTSEDATIISRSAANSLPVDLAHEVVRFYFKRQLEGLYSTMKNWGGNKLGELFNRVINNTAQTHGWDVSMDRDKVSDSSDAMRFDVYHALLNQAAATVKKVLGEAALHKQIEKVDKKANPMTFDYIDRDWYKKL